MVLAGVGDGPAEPIGAAVCASALSGPFALMRSVDELLALELSAALAVAPSPELRAFSAAPAPAEGPPGWSSASERKPLGDSFAGPPGARTSA